jgi:hypothetical protein
MGTYQHRFRRQREPRRRVLQEPFYWITNVLLLYCWLLVAFDAGKALVLRWRMVKGTGIRGCGAFNLDLKRESGQELKRFAYLDTEDDYN